MRRRTLRPQWWGRAKRTLVSDLLRSQKRWVWLMLATLVASTGSQISMALLITGFVDNGLVDQSVPLTSYVGAGVTLSLIVLVLSFAGRQLIERVVYHLEYDLRARLYRTFQSVRSNKLDQIASGQLVSRSMTDVIAIQQTLSFAPILVGAIPGLIGITGVLLVKSPVMGLLTIAALPVNAWLVNRFKRRLKALSWADLNERAEVAAAIDESVRGIRVVKAFQQEDRERRRVAAVALRAYRFAMSRERLLARFDVPLRVVPLVTLAILMVVGVSLVDADRLTLGTFLLVITAAGIITGLAAYFGELASVWQYLVTAQSRLDEVIRLAERQRPGSSLPPRRDGLRLDGVTVSLNGREVLSSVDLAVAHGELVVINGAPGSGKSTLAAVAAGMLPPDEGNVTLDGVDPRKLDIDELCRAVHVVGEEPFIFACSVRENLELAAMGATDDDALRRALWAAAADEFVDEREGGVDATVGDRGLTLSGGQRQRLALARALVNPPRVLVLDDALSAVNPSLEVEILQRIRSIAAETAIVCISRRASAATVADAVLTLREPTLEDADDAGAALVEESRASFGAAGAAQSAAHATVREERPKVGEEQVAVDEPVRVGVLASILRGALGLALLGVTLQTLGGLAPGILFGEISDLLRNGRSGDALGRTFLVFGVGVIAAAGTYVLRVYGQMFVQGVLYVLRRRIFQRLSRLGVDFYDREMPGEVATRVVNDLEKIHNFLIGKLFFAVSQIALLFGAALAVAVLSPAVFVYVVVIAVVLLATTVVQFPVAGRALSRARDRLQRVVTTFEEDFAGRQAVRGLGAGVKRAQRYLDQSWDLRAARRRATAVNNGFSVLYELIGNVGVIVVLWQAGNLVLGGTLTVGAALTLALLTRTATSLLGHVGTAYGDFLDARVSWQRFREPYGVPVLPVDEGTQEAMPPREAMRFEGVHFTYPGTQREVLRGVDFEMPVGLVVGVVGFTGAGKSSIAKLLTRTYDVDAGAGAVLLDGVDIRQLKLQSYRRRIGVVPQDAFLFRGTVASNIGYGLQDASVEDIVAAARAVGADEVLAALPGGYDHPVDEEGKNLTAAQRQLIALARAWTTKPDLLILDEATSSLDARLERNVLDAVAQLGCTTLMITHREHVAASCHRLVVLDDGRVIESGSPQELIGAGGAYDRLWGAAEPAQKKPVPVQRKRPRVQPATR